MTMMDNIPITVGRPDKFTTERRSAIVFAIGRRVPYEYAALANGISEATLYSWLEVAKHHLDSGIDSDYSQFLEDIKRAEMTRIVEHTDKISANPERWQADAWMLERRWHKHFGPSAPINELNHKLDRLNEGVLHEKAHATKRAEENEGNA